MARDRMFFKIADGIHPKYLTPARALIFQGVLASVLALSGTFEELTNLFIFAGWIFYGLAVVALFRLRRTEPQMERPYRCWGYPWVPGSFVLGALALTVNFWLDRPGRSTIGLLLIVAGLPFYRWWTRKAAYARVKYAPHAFFSGSARQRQELGHKPGRTTQLSIITASPVPLMRRGTCGSTTNDQGKTNKKNTPRATAGKRRREIDTPTRGPRPPGEIRADSSNQG